MSDKKPNKTFGELIDRLIDRRLALESATDSVVMRRIESEVYQCIQRIDEQVETLYIHADRGER